MQSTSADHELATRLRLAIARSARRLRQEAGTDLSPSLTAALATVERHGPLTPSELAARERVQRPTITRVACRLEEAGLVDARGRPGRPPLRADHRHARRPRAARRRRARARTPSSPSASRRSRPRTAPRSSGPPRCSRACSSDGGARPHLHLAAGPQLPALLRRPGRLDLGQLDADRRRDVADRAAHRQRRRGRHHRRPPVPPDAARRRAGRRARRPARQAPAADDHADADGGPRARAVGAHRRRR